MSTTVEQITTVNTAFSYFLKNIVNLDAETTQTARASRDWLFQQIHAMPGKHADFPLLYTDVDTPYGSFARRTKIRELDDIDLIVGVNAVGSVYSQSGDSISIYVADGTRLRELCFDGTNSLNSRKVINRFIKYLDEVPQYSKAESGRNGSAAVLNLSSYTWSFDIVPGFFTKPEWDGRTYYLIPDGNGYWMKTDPRIDQARVSAINQQHNGNVLNVVRILKYWQRRPIMPTARSYLFECILLGYYEAKLTPASAYVDLEISAALSHVASAILGGVNDPKGIQGNINHLSWEDRVMISNRASEDATKAASARKAEQDGDHKESIRLWGEIFGYAFPSYG